MKNVLINITNFKTCNAAIAALKALRPLLFITDLEDADYLSLANKALEAVKSSKPEAMLVLSDSVCSLVWQDATILKFELL